MTNFRVTGKNIFLTYPQCGNLTREAVKQLAMEIGDCPKGIIALEKHQDGNNHIHAHLTYAKKLNITNPNYFDIEDKHPNIQSIRNPNAVRNYVMKDKNYIWWGYESQPINNPVWHQAMELVQDSKPSQAIELLVKSKPSEMIKWGDKIENNINRMAGNQLNINKDYQFKELNKVNQWKQDYKHSKVLWLVGESGTGKTQYAKSLFSNPLLVRHKNDLSNVNSRTDVIIFDDMNFTHWPRESVIHLTDLRDPSSIDIKHGVARIPEKMPRIFTSNKWIWPQDNTGAIKRRIWVVKVREDLRIMEENEENSNGSNQQQEWKEIKQDIKIMGSVTVDRTSEPFVEFN